MSETRPTAEVTPRQAATIHKLARDTYRALGCEGFARVDFLLAGEELVVSELNTIPGFTPISLFPTLPTDGGYDFAAVCRRVVDLALEREAARVRHRLTPADLPR
jgi:D-alanine-D-alanine ligase